MGIHLFYLSKYRILAGILVLLILTAGVFFLFRAGSADGGEERLVPVYGVDTAENRISISFDASWGAEHTLEILEVLEEYHTGTTFF